MNRVNEDLLREVPMDVLVESVSEFCREYSYELKCIDLGTGYDFGDFERLFIKNYRDIFYTSGFALHAKFTYYDQIFSLLNLFPQDLDPYERVLDRVETIYGSLKGRTIVDFAAGPFAALSHKALDRVGDDGKIIAIDPNIVIKASPNIVTIKGKKDKVLKLPDDAIVIAKEPCSATTAAIDLAAVYNLQLYLVNCNCTTIADAMLSKKYDGMQRVKTYYDLDMLLHSKAYPKKIKICYPSMEQLKTRSKIWHKCSQQYACKAFASSEDLRVFTGTYFDPIIGGNGRTVTYTKKIGSID